MSICEARVNKKLPNDHVSAVTYAEPYIRIQNKPKTALYDELKFPLNQM